MNPPGFVVVLPARYGSTRFPGKPLALVQGRPLIQWVVEAAERIRGVGKVLVATDSERIVKAVQKFGGNVALTSASHATGTDRVAEIARDLEFDTIVNLQGDEPIVPQGLVEEMVSLLDRSSETDIVTACHPILSRGELENRNHVKVVMDVNGKALYFSRAPIPCHFGSDGDSAESVQSFRHIGIYAFRRQALIQFASLSPGRLEVKEGLEQLRALENGMEVRLVVTSQPTFGVDVPDDIIIVEKALAGNYTEAFGENDVSNRI
jgi:3-deoxy-manno-octulosonate cytidylyltransferase (CMP-KDO synthetase)